MRTHKAVLTALVLLVTSGIAGSAIAADVAASRALAPGDLNGNGIYDFDDVAILRSILGGAPHRYTRAQLDVDQNGAIDKADAVMLAALAERQVSIGPAQRSNASPAPSTPERKLQGDVDGDGDVDKEDFNLLQRVFAGVARPGGGYEAADVDGDGRITITDLVVLAEILFGSREPTRR